MMVRSAVGLVGGFLTSGRVLAQASQIEPGRSFDPNIPTPSSQEQQIELDRAIDKILRHVPIQPGKVTVTAPVLADNGNSVACSVVVDSPMTESDHVRELHVFLARNPRPLALSVSMGPWTGIARVDTRARLAGSQRILAVAVMNDGKAYSGFTDVVVTLSACLDGS